MMNFEHRTGPDLGTDVPRYPENGVPDWYRDAKIGFFVHWGLYSVPAWASVHGPDDVLTEDAYAHHQYAEWYGNTSRIAGSPAWERQQRIFGTGTSYEDLADQWHAERFDADAFVASLAEAGARYIIPTTKHHDGFCLWGTDTTSFNATNRGPHRDLIREFHDATRARNLRFGVYFSGALDWHVSDFPPIESDTDLFRFRRNDEWYSRYSARQLVELIERFSPDVLWNDIDWPDGGKGGDSFGVAELLTRYFSRVSDGVVNDRWGVPYHGYLTREYTHVDDIVESPWESTRGLGFSFGYNQAEGPEHSLSGDALVRFVVDVVSKNGNVLINVGPRSDGSIPELQRASMAALGAWLRVNGESIYGTRPWIRASESEFAPVSFTQSADAVHVLANDPAAGEILLPRELTDARELSWIGGGAAERTDITDRPGRLAVRIPDGLRGAPVAALRVVRTPETAAR